MAETKTIQKGWRFSEQIIAELDAIRKKALRSEQNMIEVLIHEKFQDDFGRDEVVVVDGISTMLTSKSRAADASS